MEQPFWVSTVRKRKGCRQLCHALHRVLGHPQHRGDGVKGKNLGRGAVMGAFRVYFTAVFNNQNDQSLKRGEKNIAPSRRWPPHPRPSAGSVESSCSKVSTKLTWGTCRALQLEDLLLCPLQNRSDGLLLKSWLRAWLTLDLCLLSISGVSCALLWPFMLRTSSHCG